jgi:drug/metabolite transporter (DMT)-like permease
MAVSAASLASASTSDRDATLRGLALVTVAMFLLPGQDAIAKYVSGTVSTGQIAWVRFALQALFTLPMLLYFDGPAGLVPKRLWPNVLRGALIAVSSTLFFAAIKLMPLADALAITFVSPFFLTILSAVFDKEKVGWRRWSAVAAGFVGMLVVVRPSYAVFGWASLVPAGSGFVFSVYTLLNRRLSAFDTPLAMQFTAGLSACAFMTLAVAAGWLADLPEIAPSPMGWREFGFLLGMGVLSVSGHLMFVQASRLAPTSLIAPMQYVEIVGAAVLGYAVFGDFPDFWKWVGIAIIVASGAYVFWREARVRALEK